MPLKTRLTFYSKRSEFSLVFFILGAALYLKNQLIVNRSSVLEIAAHKKIYIFDWNPVTKEMV